MSPSVQQPNVFQKKNASVLDEDAVAIAFWTKMAVFARTHQNLIFFIFLVISLGIGLLLWHNYRAQNMTQKAIYEMERTKDVEALKGLAVTYSSTSAEPFIRYKLANIYMDTDKFEDARKEYLYIIEKFSSHQVKEWATKRLEQLKISETWVQSELNAQLNELIQKRNLPRLTIKTSKGDFEAELYEDEAPNTVADFIGIILDNVYSPTTVTEINPEVGAYFEISPALTYNIPFEANTLKHQEGMIGMNRDIDPKTIEETPGQVKQTPLSGSKFYIYTNSSGNEIMDGKYTIFGRVTKGIAIVKQLAKGDTINSISINFKRPHEYKAEKVNIEKPNSTITPTTTAPLKNPQGTPIPPK
jgi:cyclophilin family peptidyl-prolyl cis-trans isomerase